MASGHGYKAHYDYVELIVEPWEGHWRLTLRDSRHGEDIVHEDQFATDADAKDAAMAFAQHHINVAHNDTLTLRTLLSWQQY